MVTKAKKALLASLAAFLCVMLTVFGLSMSVSLSETAKAADDTATELTDYVVVGGIAGFGDKKFASFEEAYNAIKPIIEKLGGLVEEPASATDFDAIFTDRDENGNAKLTYTIKGNVVYDETRLSNLLTMGRRASHYGNDRHLIKFAFVGVTADKKDTLTVNSNITLPYEWWGEKVTTSISFENLTITGSAPNGLYTYQSYFEGIDFTVNNCTLKDIKIYNCANVGGSYTITHSTLDGTGAAANAYAIHLQGNETAPLAINISGNTISGYDRGVNIDQATAVATISGNTISVKDTNRSCVQLTKLAETTIADNNLTLTGGNAITLHSNLAEGSKITVKANTIAGNGYLIYDDTKKAIDLTYGENTVAATVDMTKGVYGDTTKDLSGSVYNEVHHILKGSEKNPYTLEELGAMTRAEYIAAQEKLGGTMYVTVGNYSYDKDGVLGNGVRNDTTGQTPDHSKLNAYGENGYLGEKNDGANGKNIVFVGGSITSGATGYTSIDNIGTSLLLAVPAYTNVTFKGTEFNNVMSFNYQLYTSPWSQLGELKFDGCTFNGLIVGAIASQTLTFNGCTFTNYTNTVSANSSNPTWIRPAYGNWTKGDNEGQGGDFKSLTTINFTGNNVTSTRPVKFERIAQWEMATTVTATENKFTISAQDGDTSTKNVGLYLGANAKFDLKVENNTKLGSTAALYTAVYSAPSNASYAGLPAGSTVTDTKGNGVTVEDAYAWKTTTQLTLETTTEVAEVNGVKFATLAEAIAAAKDGETVKLLADVEQNSEVSINKDITLDLNGKKIYNTKDIWSDEAVSLIAIRGGAEVTVMGDGTIAAKANDCYTFNIVNGKLTIENGTFVGNISVVQVQKGTLTINGGTFSLLQKWKGEDRYLINCIDDAFTANIAQVAIYGGSFAGFDPNVSPEKKVDGKVPSFAAPGVGITKNENGSFTAKANMAAQILDSDGNSVAAYATLADAIAAAKDGETVKLLADCSGNGIQIKSEKFADKGLIVDFGGHTYTVGGVLVGSAGTGTNAFQLLAGNKITFQNGTIAGVSENTKPAEDTPNWHGAPAMVIQNYCDLTLKNMTVSGGDETVYTMSNNNGDVVIEDSTINAGGAKGYSYGPFAFDVCRYASYPSVSVTVRGNSVINGNVEISGAIGAGQNRQLNVENGTFNGTFSVSGNVPANIAISGGTFTNAVPAEYCADGFIPTKNTDGTYGVKEGTYVAETNGTKYETLQAAIDKAAKGATVKLLANTKENVTIAKMLTLELNGYTINGGTEKGKPAVTVTARIVTIQDSSAAQTGTIMREDTVDNSGVSSHYVIDVQGNGWLIFKSGNVINHSGNDEGKGASLVRVGDDSVAKEPGLVINGGTFTQDNFIVIKVDRGFFTLNGGTLNSKNDYAIENWFRATVKCGTVNGTVSSWTYSNGSNSTLEISGGTINGDVQSVSYDGAAGKLAKVSITGGTVNGELSHSVYGQSGDADKAMATIEVTGGTFREDPTKYVVEDSAITKNENGTYGVEKAYLARVGNTSYYTMEEAFKAQTASGEAIVLLRDYTTASTFNSGSINRVVDLNGHTWTYTGTDMNSAAFEINNPNATLTVKNGTIISSTIVGLIPSAMGGTIKYDNAGLVFDGVTMTSNGSSGIETNGNNTNDSVTLKNSTLNVPNGFGIYFPSSGTLTIDNSTINAKTMGVQVCSGELNINAGSAITVTGNSVPKAENDGAIQDGAAISIVNRPGYKGLSNIVITGGTFTANAGNDAIKAYDWVNKVESTFTKADLVAVSGGTFSSEVNKDYLADGFVVNKNTDGTYGVKAAYVAEVNGVKYETLQAAFEAARVGTSKVVTLLADYTATEKSSDGPGVVYDITGVTFDLGGHKFSASNFAVVFAGSNGVIQNGEMICLNGSYALFIGDEIETKGFTASNLTLTGGINVYNATMVVLDNLTVNGTNYYAVWADEHASITIESGTYTAGDVAALNAAAKSAINVTGGTFITNDKPLMGNSKGTLQISGGTFSSEVNKDYLVDRFVVNKNTDGTYGVTAGSGFAGTYVVVTESLAMKVVVGTASKYVVVTYKGLDGIAKTVRLDKFTDIKIEGKDYKYCLFDQIMPQMIDVKFSFELYGENDVMLDRKANYSVVDYLADIIKRGKDSAAFRNVAASLIEYANKARAVKGLTTTVAPTFVDKDGKTVTLDYNAFVDAHKIPAKDTLGAISEGSGQVIYKAKVVFDDAYTLKFYTNAGDGKYTYTLSKNGSTEEEGITFDKNGEFTINVLAQDITTQYVIKVYGEDKTKPIQTVTYGVSTYCIRMQETKTPQGELYVASYYYGVAVQQYGAANTASVQV